MVLCGSFSTFDFDRMTRDQACILMAFTLVGMVTLNSLFGFFLALFMEA
jgi:hypothetical protein